MPIEPNPVDIGVAFAVVLLILKEVFGFIQKVLAQRKNGTSSAIEAGVPPQMAAYLKDMEREFLEPVRRHVAELHNWHNVTDSDGVRVWYVRPSLVVSIERLSVNIAAQTEILRTQISVLERVVEVQKKMMEGTRKEE